MDQLVGVDEIESLRFELAEIGRSIRSSFRSHASSFRSSSSINPAHDVDNSEVDALQWNEIQRLPTFERITSALFDEHDSNGMNQVKGRKVVDVSKLGAQERHLFIEKLIKHIENDNLLLLQKLRKRIDKVGIKLPTVEVRYQNLTVEAECQVVKGKPIPTLWNTIKGWIIGASKLLILQSQNTRISIIKDASGIIKPGRMTLLLGPPGSGKTTLLLALAGKLDHSLKVQGEISYNGYTLDEFIPQKSSAYVSQYDLHIPEMTVRETLDFSARCQGVGSKDELLKEVSRREKEAGIMPDPDLDAYMKATSVKGLKSTLQTDYILKILGLDICADTLVGDPVRRGISGGQKKRLTTGEMIVGPTRALFMDEISNGLDSSTTFQITSCLQHMVHITDATALISLLQPAPETFDLFDDIVLMAEGKIVYHGPRDGIVDFFEDCGFKCPQRKGTADFLQEVISRKDQAQYWSREEPYRYVTVEQFVEKFRYSPYGKKLDEEISKPFDKSQSHKNALAFRKYSLTKWEMFKACIMREFLLMKRNSFVYVFKSTQLVIVASIGMTVFIRTQMPVDSLHGNYFMGSLFYSLIILLVDGIPELSMTVSRLSVFYKQKELCFYPAWAYSIPSTILKIPLSLLESFIWTALTYYVIGYSPEIGRFFRQFLLLFTLHMSAISMFRFIASVFQNVVTATTAGTLTILTVLLFGGFILPKPYMPSWLRWGFWISPMSYGELAVTVNEFLAPRWQKMSTNTTTLGRQILENRGLNFDGYFYWISIGALVGFTVLFNTAFTLILTFVKAPSRSRALISSDKHSELQGSQENKGSFAGDRTPVESIAEPSKGQHSGGMVLPFQPLTVTFRDVQYYVDTPMEMRNRGFSQKLQLLCDITGSLRPGILTALMGVSGAGKTTLLDVICGRKTGGTIEGDIRIGGYPKVQETFARISGYCEQNDIHSPNITVEESVMFSAWLRLPPEIDAITKSEFVKEVLHTIELDGIKDLLVGLPNVSGLSTEQRKRLTIAIELVANPSIIFMDEPTSGLDARAAAVVMRAVKNVVRTGRTVTCTIHQPSIDIFEAFDELILMKTGGRIIYSGPLGQHSSRVIEYFERVPGVPKIKDNYNPSTWMLEVTSGSAEVDLGVDFAQIYRESTLYEQNRELVEQLSSPAPGSKDLYFASHFPQNGWEQFKACLWKQHLSYWRNPSYNLMRIIFVIAASFLFGILFWKKGNSIHSQQDLFNVFGSMFMAVLFFGINNGTTVVPVVVTERTVLYREKYAGMYSPWAYSFAQVIIEVPYLLTEAVLYVLITYPMIGYHWSAYKVFWSVYSIFCNLLSFSYLGMLIVSFTPNVQVATIVCSSFYTMLNLFSGYIVPLPHIPKWWIWMYYICPTSWAMNGMLTSQYGDINKEISVTGFNDAGTKTISEFLRDYYGFHHDMLGVTALLLIVFPLVSALLFAYCIGHLSFLRR
ncbi:drug-responsive transcription factor pdr3 [Stylosanthes scabra]|uniref:Drug-responsive transcription factor pdr3 n=1 Tax=Stylosanthes scabra TaxID=79078 RepID=A0ABU6SHS6_9FABA|nr:drug-responsive transcription factor pdr3 [Stylosanthes scabra]